ncbi:protein of unknown function DUF59 [Thermocrinis albus DSM 14484]|uniref:MIP18 family-like domain-containing protein n=1 Tax=Thermocrinis albus (strain DSM 14484 / JCM 11386 / HI 11/12) TaxID=638303 RepID=D3SLJ7_THEAH|nr:metal-sulfur cluster assembly factor [Thermocrinis albus]ADC89627.1 protein of unknown function DUF59 [Thermocrinis albus DSM 14484]
MTLEELILESLKKVKDPEIPLDIVNLGLVYGVQVKDGIAYVDMTLTVQGCPAKSYFAHYIREFVLSQIPQLKDVVVNFVFEPPWDKDKISEEGKTILRSMGWNI